MICQCCGNAEAVEGLSFCVWCIEDAEGEHLEKIELNEPPAAMTDPELRKVNV